MAAKQETDVEKDERNGSGKHLNYDTDRKHLTPISSNTLFDAVRLMATTASHLIDLNRTEYNLVIISKGIIQSNGENHYLPDAQPLT